MKNTSKSKMIQKLFSLSHRHIEMIADLFSTGLFSSESDIIRQSIAKLHELKFDNKNNQTNNNQQNEKA